MITIDQIQRVVAEFYEIRLVAMTIKSRARVVAWPRQTAIFLSRQLTESSLDEIGMAFGGRGHPAIVDAIQAVTDRMGNDEQVKETVKRLEERLRQLKMQNAKCKIKNLKCGVGTQ